MIVSVSVLSSTVRIWKWYVEAVLLLEIKQKPKKEKSICFVESCFGSKNGINELSETQIIMQFRLRYWIMYLIDFRWYSQRIQRTSQTPKLVLPDVMFDTTCIGIFFACQI